MSQAPDINNLESRSPPTHPPSAVAALMLRIMVASMGRFAGYRCSPLPATEIMFNILLDSRGWSMLRVRAGALVLFGLFGGVAALAPASPAAADAAVVDLAIQYVGTSLTNVIVGDSFGTTVVVSNVGTRTSNAFVVVVSAPSSLQISPQPAFATWSCSPIASGVTCSHEGLQPGETDVLSLPTTLVAGTPADKYLSFTYPNVGDDATDSDVATAGSDPWVLAGRSDPTYVTSYGEVVIDAGLIERTQL